MSPTGAEVIRQIKQPGRGGRPGRGVRAPGNGIVLVDVRETEEWDAGHIPGAKHVPRGYLESRIEGAVAGPRRARRPLLRLRPALRARRPHAHASSSATRTSRSMTGGITLWKDRGYKVEVPKSLTARAARALLAPPAAAGDRARGPDQAARAPRCCCSAPAGSARRPRSTSRRPASARSASSTTTRSTSPTSSARSSTRPTASARRRSTPPRRRSTRINPDVKVVKYHDAPRRLQHHGDHRGLRRDRRRRRQLPDALPAQRRDGAARHPGRLGLDPRLRRPALGLQAARRARATAACTRCRRRPSWRRPAAPTACSACCRARWACCRRPRSSSSSPAPASRWSAACCSTRRWARRSPSSRSAATRSARSARSDPSEITDEEMGVFPDYEAFCAAAG